ncbi:MAG: hypothetical protein O7H41_13910 [Planctomycetota bacterium]|nr:hypothetical protein [Planctomycetota bacterium]
MPRRRGLINRSAVKSRFASAGFRTSGEVLDHLEAIVGAAIKAGIRGMVGRATKTITVEEISRGKLLGDPTVQSNHTGTPPSRRKVNRGILRR